jgi:3-hydroxybutyryl-CoA dehydrogenase
MGSALPPSVTVAVIGAGTMGAGIAQIAALAGHRVQLHDMRFGAGDEAKRRIAEALAREVAKGRLAAEAADAAVARIGTVVTLPDTCVAGLVIEAIAEDLAVKRELFGGLEHVVAADCILASNTSSLSITSLGTGLKHPARVAGMHFFNPVPLMPLVEIVGGLATDRGVAETLFATAIAWGKTPVHAASTPGFIVNRCARPFYGEAWRLLAERAADTATIDAVVREAGGFRMGPFELMDLVGHDVNLAVTQSVWEAYYCDARYTPSPLQREPAGPRPAAVTIHGEAPAVQALGSRIAASGAAVAKAPDDVRLGGPALRVTGTDGGAVWLAPADGRAATARAVAAGLRDLVAFDLALDYAKATRLAIAHADTCDAAAGALAAGALQAAGCAVSRVDDVPGMIVLRTVAMLANEAADAVVQGVAEPEAIDLAMEKGVSYPLGPLAWADRLGAATLATVLGHLAAAYPGERYRASPLIRRRALTGGAVDG